MRETRTHLAVVQSADAGDVRGVITLSDVVDRLLPGTAAATT